MELFSDSPNDNAKKFPRGELDSTRSCIQNLLEDTEVAKITLHIVRMMLSAKPRVGILTDSLSDIQKLMVYEAVNFLLSPERLTKFSSSTGPQENRYDSGVTSDPWICFKDPIDAQTPSRNVTWTREEDIQETDLEKMREAFKSSNNISEWRAKRGGGTYHKDIRTVI